MSQFLARRGGAARPCCARTLPLVLLWLACPGGAVAAEPAAVAAPPPTAPAPDPAPSLALPSGLQLRPKAWVLTDTLSYRRTESGYGVSRHTDFQLRSARVQADWALDPRVSGRFAVELSSANPDAQEAWVQLRIAEPLALRAGRVRVPFGLAQQVPIYEQRLFEAPMLAGNPKDYRDIGIMALGSLGAERLSWAAAAVTGSRDLAVDVNETPDLALRVLLRPAPQGGPWLRGLHLGLSLGAGAGPTRHGVRGRSAAGYTFAAPPTVRGGQRRAGAELEWTTPRLHLAAEAQWQEQARTELTALQRVGTSNVSVADLEPWVVSGASLEAAALLWGEPDPAARLPHHGVELCLRWERFDFGDGERSVASAAGSEDHAPLQDSWAEAIAAGLQVYAPLGLRGSLTYQLLRLGAAELAPDYEASDAGVVPDGASEWVQHLFVRVGWVY